MIKKRVLRGSGMERRGDKNQFLRLSGRREYGHPKLMDCESHLIRLGDSTLGSHRHKISESEGNEQGKRMFYKGRGVAK